MRRPSALLFWLILIALVAQGVRDGGWNWPDGGTTRRAPPSTGDVIAGRARVVDGDSLEVDGHRIRLFGIDAPEGRQSCRDAQDRSYPCGQNARRQLTELIGGQRVTCTPVGESHDRDVSVCTAGTRDLSEAMVRAGHAIELRNFSQGRFSEAEREARNARRGIWAGTFERPSAWRHGNMR